MSGSKLDIFSDRGVLVPKDVTPWQTFSGRGMTFSLQSYDWNHCVCVSYLTMRALFGLMKMETLICTPYAADLPLFSYDYISAFGRKTLLAEFYDTQVSPADLSALQTVKEAYSDLRDKPKRPGWYNDLLLPPSVSKVGDAARLSALATDMMTAYVHLFASARKADLAAKSARNSAYVEGLIHDGPTFRVVSRMIGAEAAKTVFRRFLFGTEQEKY